MTTTSLVIINNKKTFSTKVKRLKQGGISSLHIVADFDGTLTTEYATGQKRHTAIAQIRQGNYLTPDYPKRAWALHDKYRAIELDPSISHDKKAQAMLQWWTEHINLLVECGMNKAVVDDIVKKRTMVLRDGCDEFFGILARKNIPLLILSSAIGDIIEGIIQTEGTLTKNIHVISNFFDYDKQGKVRGYKGQVIHSHNKREAEIKKSPLYKEIAKRRNIILLGNTLEDLQMCEGTNCNMRLTIGFYNEPDQKNLEAFSRAYDLVILDDGSMEEINKLLREVTT